MTTHTIEDSRQDTRTRILDEAERLFRHYGYAKTTVADIARELGMSPANVYRFFPSKLAINEGIAERLLDQRLAATLKIIRGPGSPTERLRQVLLANHRMTVDLLHDEKKVHEMVKVAMAEQWSVVMRFIERMNALVAELMAEGMDAGEFRRMDPLLASRCAHKAFVAFIHPDLLVEFLSEQHRVEPEQQVDFILSALRA